MLRQLSGSEEDQGIYLQDGSVLPEFLYRIVPFARAVEMLQTRKMALSSPLAWEDPYEAGHLRVSLESPLFRDVDGAIKRGMAFLGTPTRVGLMSQGGDAIKSVHCQSWTATPETDTMWRAYSPDCNGVRLRARPHSLLRAIKGAFPQESCFLSEVAYVPQSTLDEQLRNGPDCYRLQVRRRVQDGIVGLGWLPSLSTKRLEFHQEREYRISVIANTPGSQDLNSWQRFRFFPLDFASMVEQVTVDPRSDSLQHATEKLRALGYCGFIDKSTLYDPPDYRFWQSNHPH